MDCHCFYEHKLALIVKYNQESWTRRDSDALEEIWSCRKEDLYFYTCSKDLSRYAMVGNRKPVCLGFYYLQ